MDDILRNIRQSYPHINQGWKLSNPVLAEMTQHSPFFVFDILAVGQQNFERSEHTQRQYNTAMHVVEIMHPAGLHIMHAHVDSTSDGFLHIHTRRPFVQLYFALNNNRSYFADNELIGALDAGQYQAYLFYPKQITALWNVRTNDEFVEINFSLPLFLSFCQQTSEANDRIKETIKKKKTTALFPTNYSISHQQKQILLELKDKPSLSESSFPLYIQAKVMHLLALILDQACASDTAAKEQLKIPVEIAQLMQQAKVLLDQEIDNPPSISELSMRLGTNENYLKKYFKKIHNSTIHHYVNNRRMQIAKDLLLENDKPINEISRFLGYKSPAHLSANFKKHFGLNPKIVQKKESN